jgi:ankyrin repeat protein
MKSLKFALAPIALLTAAMPALAQLGTGPDSQQFVEAVEKQDGDKATQLIRTKPRIVDSRNNKGDTALIIALNRSDRNWTGFLLNEGADPNLPGNGGDTPLITASRIGFEEAAEWLLNMGAKVDGANKMGETPLIVAVQQRQVPMVKLLLNAGANPDKADTAAGLSARDYATRDTRSRQILLLIEAKKPKAASASR